MSRNAPVALVEAGTFAEAQRLGHVDLHMVDEVSIPIGSNRPLPPKRNARMFAAAFLAQEVVDAEDLLFGETSLPLGVQRHGAGQIGAEGFSSDDRGCARRDRPSASSRIAGRAALGGPRSNSARDGSAPTNESSAASTAAFRGAGAGRQRE